MDDSKKDIIELLASFADALSEVIEFTTIYVTEPAYWLHGKVGLIRLETWTSECLSTENELMDELSSLCEKGEEDEADEILFNAYWGFAWDDAEVWARSEGGELLDVHLTRESTLSAMVFAYLIAIDEEKFYNHRLPKLHDEDEGDDAH